MKDRVLELCLIFNNRKFNRKFNINDDIIELLIKLIISIENPQIIYNTRIYNIHRTYNIDYLNLYLNKPNYDNKIPLIRTIDRKFNKHFQIFMEKIMLVNYHISKVLNREKDIGFRNNRFNNMLFNNMFNFHRILISRYKLAYSKMKKINIVESINNDYKSLVMNIYNHFEKIFINNCKSHEFIDNIRIRQI
jgi:hypothetical protein